MTNVTNSASKSIVSILSTIGSMTNAVSKIVDTGASSIDMLDTYVQRAKDHQQKQNLIEDTVWLRNLIIDAAHEQEKKESQIAKEYAGDKNRQQIFTDLTTKFESLFTPAGNP